MNSNTIVTAKRQALAARKAKTPIEAIRSLASMQKRPQPVLSTVTNGAQTLLIGQIRHTEPPAVYDPVASALRLLRMGADALTLFTDETIYEDGLNDLTLVSRAVNAPVISQDYIFDEYQVVEARAAGASGLMLYAELLDMAALRTLVSAAQRNRMTAIVQVTTVDQLSDVLSISPQVIAIHSGDLLNMGELKVLHALIPCHIHTFIAHPLTHIDEAQAIAALKPDAVLISETFLNQPDSLERLRQSLHRVT